MIERIKTRAKKSEQCAGFFRVSYKRKTPQAFFNFRLHQAIPSSAEELCAYLIKEKRLGRFSTLDFINQIRAVRDLQRAR